MIRFALLAALAVTSVTSAFSFYQPISTPSSTAFYATDRRVAIRNILLGPAIVGASPALAIDACGKKANNCILQVWSPPVKAPISKVTSDIREVINAYPQEGQADVDGGGYTIVDDKLAGGATPSMRVEYRSSGKGKLAKFFNGGKPFVDDLIIEVLEGSKGVEFRSASRVGDSDFGVNAKRLAYLGNLFKTKGWSIE
mmetsp:Transcript_4651/g.9817  ORF Transcript_4651/g.9817 Transcript_4651/m.9817 type:complete len:198 (-) Transcript_4651:43-636(-)